MTARKASRAGRSCFQRSILEYIAHSPLSADHPPLIGYNMDIPDSMLRSAQTESIKHRRTLCIFKDKDHRNHRNGKPRNRKHWHH